MQPRRPPGPRNRQGAVPLAACWPRMGGVGVDNTISGAYTTGVSHSDCLLRQRRDERRCSRFHFRRAWRQPLSRRRSCPRRVCVVDQADGAMRGSGWRPPTLRPPVSAWSVPCATVNVRRRGGSPCLEFAAGRTAQFHPQGEVRQCADEDAGADFQRGGREGCAHEPIPGGAAHRAQLGGLAAAHQQRRQLGRRSAGRFRGGRCRGAADGDDGRLSLVTARPPLFSLLLLCGSLAVGLHPGHHLGLIADELPSRRSGTAPENPPLPEPVEATPETLRIRQVSSLVRRWGNWRRVVEEW